MTLRQAITSIDNLKYNTYTLEQKLQWLSDLESRIYTEILTTHEGAPAEPFTPFTRDTDLDRVLAAPAPYDIVYLRQLETQMDYQNGELNKYNNSSQLFNSAYAGFRRWYNRTHLPKTGSWQFP
jgi:hypothetical protein